MTEDDTVSMAVQAGLRDYVAEFFKSELCTFAKYVEVATLLGVEKRIEALLSHEDPIVQSGALTVLKELRGEK